MKVFALIGSSGTGKSHNAVKVAWEKEIDTIIDDGILIRDGRKLAGISAKAADTKAQAVKRAIFLNDNHAREVREKLKEIRPDKLLILGTSRKMISRITDKMEIPFPEEKNIIPIEHVSSAETIKEAQKIRREQGKHVIPLPTIEIKKDFPDYLIDPLQVIMRKMGIGKVEEKSIIRPKFSVLGKLIISENAINQLIEIVGKNYPLIDQISRTKISISDDGVSVNADLIMFYGKELHFQAYNFQKNIVDTIQRDTGLSVIAIDLNVKGLSFEKKK